VAAPDVRPILIPDDFTVWAGTDFHGQLAAVRGLLRDAAICDEDDRWIAPAGTALVVCGDMVDRGPDSLGLVRLLARLRAEAPGLGGMVALLEGNHEAQVLGGLAAEPAIYRAFMTFGGGALLASLGMTPDEWASAEDPEEVARRARERAPDLESLLWSCAPYARWNDVLFVHAGPVPDAPSLEDFERHATRIWIRDAFFASPEPFPAAPAWAAYRDAGIRRVVFGHTPVEAPALYHDGHALNLDTWRGGRVTLARLAPDAALADAVLLARPAEPRAIADAPVTADAVRGFDADLPAIVDAFTARVFAARSTAR
jgi:serine/threonine protein phosphatase 1